MWPQGALRQSTAPGLHWAGTSARSVQGSIQAALWAPWKTIIEDAGQMDSMKGLFGSFTKKVEIVGTDEEQASLLGTVPQFRNGAGVTFTRGGSAGSVRLSSSVMGAEMGAISTAATAIAKGYSDRPEPADPNADADVDPESLLGQGKAKAAASVVDEIHSSGAPSLRRASRDTGFASLRFGPEHGVLEMAKELQAVMEEDGVDLRIINMLAGGDIDREVFSAIEYASTFIVFGSMRYGEDTGNQACTYYEYKHAKSENKKIILIRMIPWEEKHGELHGRVIFSPNILALYWKVGTPMPSDLSIQIMESMGQPQDKIATARANAKRRAAATLSAALDFSVPVVANTIEMPQTENLRPISHQLPEVGQAD